jgi:hypothetical protein
MYNRRQTFTGMRASVQMMIQIHNDIFEDHQKRNININYILWRINQVQANFA